MYLLSAILLLCKAAAAFVIRTCPEYFCSSLMKKKAAKSFDVKLISFSAPQVVRGCCCFNVPIQAVVRFDADATFFIGYYGSFGLFAARENGMYCLSNNGKVIQNRVKNSCIYFCWDRGRTRPLS